MDKSTIDKSTIIEKSKIEGKRIKIFVGIGVGLVTLLILFKTLK